eukprot:scaffold36047_cov21-Tisochrysis_lutea.AAC.2
MCCLNSLPPLLTLRHHHIIITIITTCRRLVTGVAAAVVLNTASSARHIHVRHPIITCTPAPHLHTCTPLPAGTCAVQGRGRLCALRRPAGEQHTRACIADALR